MINVNLQQDKYVMTFQYDPDLVEFCKRLQRSRYDGSTRTWTAERNVPNAIDLMHAGYYHDKDMLTVIHENRELGAHDWKSLGIPYEYQLRWYDWCKGKLRSLLVAEMGLGKTFMALQWLRHLKVAPHEVLIVSPVSLLDHWVEQGKTFTGEDFVPITGSSTKKRLEKFKTRGTHVVNYEFVTQNNDCYELAKTKRVLICDESHRCKDPQSQRSKTMFELSKSMDAVLLLTGTPVSQGAEDYYSQIRLLNSKLLGSSFTAFKCRYCTQEQVRGAPVGVRRITGYVNLDELVRIINPVTFSLLKKDCLDLPDKIYTRRYVEMCSDQAVAYYQLKKDMVSWLASGEEVTTNNILTRLIRLSQVIQGFVKTDTGDIHHFKDNPKLKDLQEFMIDLPAPTPLMVMCRFKEDIRQVKTLMDKLHVSTCVMDGDSKPADRHDMVQEFRAGRYRVMIGQIRVAGVGINAEHCKNMYFFSNEYGLIDRLQAEDRIHRATSTGSACVYTDVVMKDTVDLNILAALRAKKNVSDMLHELKASLT